MEATVNSTTYAAIGVRNRLEKDLAELQRAAAAAGTLPADDAGAMFDMSVNLRQAKEALGAAIADIERYIAHHSLSPDRTAKLERAQTAADLLNEVFA